MNRTIWKSTLRATDIQEIPVPTGSEFLCAREQHDHICVWYRCDPAAPLEHRKIAVVGTGHPAPADGRYLGSAALHGGELVFHVFAWPH